MARPNKAKRRALRNDARVRAALAREAEWETCPDCSDRDAVSFTFGHVERRAVNDPAAVGGDKPVLQFGHDGRTKGCQRCNDTGRIPAGSEHDIATAKVVSEA